MRKKESDVKERERERIKKRRRAKGVFSWSTAEQASGGRSEGRSSSPPGAKRNKSFRGAAVVLGPQGSECFALVNVGEL